ncbi:MAG: efflux RND transporter periplasmic adaptor subunit [Thermodesulfobacteriota bacterium]|nr:efflux RND transporter periplasmic adaptor subunit [Thermodesulfobacteriota bacterium]
MRLNKKVYKYLKWNVVLATLSASLLLGGCDGTGRSQPQPRVPEVAVVTVQLQKVVLTTELPGRASAFRVANIRPQVNGLILKCAFKEGSNVKAGDLLYQIDPAPYQAAYDQTRAAVAMTEANLPALRSRVERFKELLTVHAVGQQDYDDANAALRQMEAQLAVNKASMESARINLSYTPIKAPISGRIGKSNVTEGAIVTAYQPIPLATIQQLDPIYVDVPQSTADILRLRQRLEDGRLYCNVKDQREVSLLLDNRTSYPLKGAFQFRDVTVDSTTGSVILRIVFPNPDYVLLPNMFVRAILQECVAEQAVLIPQQSVSRDPKGNPLTLVVNSRDIVEQRRLELDRAIGNDWLVSSGLAPGERIIVEGIQKVRPGATVKIVPFNKDKTRRGPEAEPDVQPQEKTDGGA